MMSRLMFNLRQGASPNKNNYETTLFPASTVQFKHKERATRSTTDIDDSVPTRPYGTDNMSEDPDRTRVVEELEMLSLSAIVESPRDV